MAKTKQEINKYQDDYKRKYYDRFNLLLPKGTKITLQKIADRREISVNAIINQLIAGFISANSEIISDPAGADTAGDCTSSDESGKENPEE